MSLNRAFAPLLFVLAGLALPVPAQAGADKASARAFARIYDLYGPESERRFVRAYADVERSEFRRLASEFLQNRERALREFLTRYPIAPDSHRARLLLAQTLVYRQADEEAESLLKMVILTTENRELEYEARFTLANIYRRTDLIKARVFLREMAASELDDEVKARACFELATLLDDRPSIPVLRQGGALQDGLYQRRCRLQLAHLALRKAGRLETGQPAPAFRVYLIYFWSARARDAKSIRTYLGAMNQNYADGGFKIIGVNLDGDAEQLKKSATAGQYPWIEVGDRWGKLTELALRYAPNPAPYFVLVDRSGIIRFEGDLSVPDSAARYPETDLWKQVAISLRSSRSTT
jgi:hypothetical protein